MCQLKRPCRSTCYNPLSFCILRQFRELLVSENRYIPACPEESMTYTSIQAGRPVRNNQSYYLRCSVDTHMQVAPLRSKCPCRSLWFLSSEGSLPLVPAPYRPAYRSYLVVYPLRFSRTHSHIPPPTIPQ